LHGEDHAREEGLWSAFKGGNRRMKDPDGIENSADKFLIFPPLRDFRRPNPVVLRAQAR
jgi:hypothetical protein